MILGAAILDETLSARMITGTIAFSGASACARLGSLPTGE